MKAQAFNLFVFVALVLGLFLPSLEVNAGIISSLPSDFQSKTELLQYEVKGHVLGFAPDKVILAGSDHALTISFVGSKNVLPKPDSDVSVSDTIIPFSRVMYDGLWDGIRLDFSAQSGSIYSTTYTLAPGADPSNIRLRYNAPVSLNLDGTLHIDFKSGTLTESAPVAWQEIQGRHVPVDVSFLVQGQEVTFAIGKYDPRHTLNIDPSLIWNTFLGGSGFDFGYSIIVDETENVYVVGASNADWGCTTLPCTLRPFSGGNDIYVSKLDPFGNLVWNTFLGGSGNDNYYDGADLNIDQDGNFYVTGGSNADWGCSPLNCTVRAYSSGPDTFIAKLDQSGNLLWNTFLGGSGEDSNGGIGVSTVGNIYVSGTSNMGWGCEFPAVACTVAPFHGNGDAFVAELDSSGHLIWNTFIGESGGFNFSRGIVLDSFENIYVVGRSFATWGSPVRSFTSPYDGFVAKLDSTGSLLWNTFLGGSGGDNIYDIKLDSTGNIYVCGDSTSTWGNPVRPFTSDYTDAFVAMLDASGNLLWNTFLGGYSHDNGISIVVDGDRNIYLAGSSGSSWGRPVRPFSSNNVGGDGFLVKLNSNGDLLWNAFLGGDGWDGASGVYADANRNEYVTGYSTLSWGEPVNPIGSGFYKGYVVKMNISLLVASIVGMNPNPTYANSVDYKVLFSDSVTGVDISDFSLNTTGSIANASVSNVSGSGSYYTVTVNTGMGSGILRLDVIDDDTIMDPMSNPLGGPGLGNGDLTGDESYVIDKTPPSVVSSVGVNVIYTGETSKEFVVTFSEPVSGVGLSDFTLTTNGVTGASISSVSGSGGTYTVIVSHDRGAGTIRLNVIDDDTIVDVVNLPLGGVGLGNGDFTNGEFVWNSTIPNLFADPSFEALPNPYWAQTSSNFGTPLCTISICGNSNGTVGPHTGYVWGWFGGTSNFEQASLSQAVVIPSGYDKLKLQFYFLVGGTGNSNNIFDVTVDGYKVFSTDVTKKGAYLKYTPVTIDVSQFADDSVHTVKFLSQSYGQVVNFNLDDVVLANFTFHDVPTSHWAWSYIEHLSNAGVTGGCSINPQMYCPDTHVTRAQMAVFLLRGEHGSAYVPPSVGSGTGFTDVPADYWAAAWIKQLALEGITSGCGPALYCPEISVTRDQMAVFLLRAEHGASYTPPPATGVFSDVPVTYWAAAWIERLAAEGITGGCGAGTYCPTTPVTRDQMAVFLVKTFNLP